MGDGRRERSRRQRRYSKGSRDVSDRPTTEEGEEEESRTRSRPHGYVGKDKERNEREQEVSGGKKSTKVEVKRGLVERILDS